MKKTTCSIAALILAGCASAGRIGDLPAITEGSPSATLVLIRPSNVIGMTNSDYVALDGKDVFSIRSGDNTRFAIPPGPHAVAVKCFGGWSPTWKEDSKAFVAEGGGTSYFSISPSMKCSKIEPVSEADGKALLGRTTFVDPAGPSSNKETPSSPGSSDCPLQWRHGVREPVCASQALSPKVAQLPPPSSAQPAAEHNGWTRCPLKRRRPQLLRFAHGLGRSPRSLRASRSSARFRLPRSTASPAAAPIGYDHRAHHDIAAEHRQSSDAGRIER